MFLPFQATFEDALHAAPEKETLGARQVLAILRDHGVKQVGEKKNRSNNSRQRGPIWRSLYSTYM